MTTAETDDAPARRARLICYGLVVLLVFSAVDRAEWWPLSSFRLFSQPRTAVSTRWEVALVDGAGGEHLVAFAGLPRGYRGSHVLAAELRTLSPPARDAVCRAWAAAGAARLGVLAAQVRVYRVTGRVPTGPDRPEPPGRRALHVTCAGVAPG